MAHAQDETAVNAAPPETVSVLFVIVFGVVFAGMITGFFWHLWMNERERKREKSGSGNVI